MPFAAGIKFRKDSFSKYFNPADVPLDVDEFCVVKDPELGFERVGFVSCMEGRAPIQMQHLPRVLRIASDTEIEAWYELQIREREMIGVARDRAEVHNLKVKISDVVMNEEKRQVLVHFTADGRIDFRELVKDLAGRFRARIEMWQIGARKEAGLIDGIGICGNRLCCSNWLKDFPAISMRHAKDQDIVQPPSKLSGPCGRLRCCLRYEHETYVQLLAGAPALGCTGCTSGGKCGVVIDRNALKQEVVVKDESGSISSMPFGDFTPDKNWRPPPERDRRGGRAPKDDEDEAVVEDGG